MAPLRIREVKSLIDDDFEEDDVRLLIKSKLRRDFCISVMYIHIQYFTLF